jgi:hypothetical protein
MIYAIMFRMDSSLNAVNVYMIIINDRTNIRICIYHDFYISLNKQNVKPPNIARLNANEFLAHVLKKKFNTDMANLSRWILIFVL